MLAQKSLHVWRAAIRPWRRRPLMAAIVVLTLAASIAGAAATFAVVQVILRRPLPYGEPDRLVRMLGVATPPDELRAVPIAYDRSAVHLETWHALQESPVFAGVGAWLSHGWVVLEETKTLVNTVYASSNLLPVLITAPAAGRGFTQEDETRATEVAMIGHHLWRTSFGGTSDIIGRRIVLNRGLFGKWQREIVGVLPPGFSLGGDLVDVMVSFNGTAPFSMHVVGRLRSEASLSAATSVVQSMINISGRGRPFESARAVFLADDERRTEKSPLLLQFGGAIIILFIACSSIGVLFHQEVQRRAQEVAIRSALGAGPFEAAKPIALAFAGLGAMGVAAAVPLSWWAIRLFMAARPATYVQGDSAGISYVAGVFALVAGSLAAAIPVVTATASSIRHWRRPMGPSLGRQAQVTSRVVGQRVAVGLQLALALVLVVGASLFSETMIRLATQPLGFEPERLLMMSTLSQGPLTETKGPEILDPARSPVLAALAGLPNVVTVAATSVAPLRGAAVGTPIDIPGIGSTRPIEWRVVSPGYFQTVRDVHHRRQTFTTAARCIRSAVMTREFPREFLGGRPWPLLQGERVVRCG